MEILGFAFLILIVIIVTGIPFDTTFGLFLLSAIIVIAIGMLADLIDKRLK